MAPRVIVCLSPLIWSHFSLQFFLFVFSKRILKYICFYKENLGYLFFGGRIAWFNNFYSSLDFPKAVLLVLDPTFSIFLSDLCDVTRTTGTTRIACIHLVFVSLQICWRPSKNSCRRKLKPSLSLNNVIYNWQKKYAILQRPTWPNSQTSDSSISSEVYRFIHFLTYGIIVSCLKSQSAVHLAMTTPLSVPNVATFLCRKSKTGYASSSSTRRTDSLPTLCDSIKRELLSLLSLLSSSRVKKTRVKRARRGDGALAKIFTWRVL